MKVPGVVLEVVSSEWRWGRLICYLGFTHSRAPNDNIIVIVIIVFAVIGSRSALGWRVQVLG